MEDYQETNQEEIQKRIQEKWNPLLLEGAKNNDLEKIEYALNEDAEVNYSDKNGWCSVFWVCHNGNLDLLNFFNRKQALTFFNSKIKIKDNQYNHLDFADNIKIQLGEIVEKPLKSPLQKAALKGHFKICAYLIKQGFKYTVLDEYYNNCFHLACSSNNFETVKIFLQIGVYSQYKNTRGHKGIDLTSNQNIINLLKKCDNTINCSITSKIFQDFQIKYLCSLCYQFFSKDGSVLEWIYLDNDKELNFYPQCRCLQCDDQKNITEKDLEEVIKQESYEKLNNFLTLIQKKNQTINLQKLEHAKQECYRYKIQEEFLATLKSLEIVENYKTIKKSVSLIEDKLKLHENEGVLISNQILDKIHQNCHRLISERNLRHYISITDFNNFTQENYDILKELLHEAQINKVSNVYLEQCENYLHKMKVILDAKKLLEQFTQYPIREYPPEPKWDKRRKQWLDGTTGKPLDPKKPQILPLNPPKKKKKKKKKGQNEEFQIPEWATNRKDFLENINILSELIVNEKQFFEQNEKRKQISSQNRT